MKLKGSQVTPKHEWLLIGSLATLSAGGYAYLQFSERDLPAVSPASEAPTEEIAAADALPTFDAPRPLAAPVLTTTSLTGSLPSKGQWRGTPQLADLNGDGKLDLVASIRRWDHSTPAEGLHVWLGDGAGGWTAANEGLRRDMSYGGVEVADVNNDGFADIAFSGHDVTPRVFLGDGTGKWTAMSAGIDIEAICSDVALGDLDGDGNQDLAVLGFYPKEGGLVVYIGDGFGAFHRFTTLLDPVDYGAELQIVDLDGEGLPELIAATSLGPKVWHLEGGEWTELTEGLPTPEIGGSELSVAAHDFDGDGVRELVVAGMVYDGHPPLAIYRWDGETWSTWGDGLPTDEAFYDVGLAQLGPDTQPTIVTAGRFGINLISMTSPGVFERVGRLEDTEGVINICIGDVDADGRDEIAYVGFDGIRILSIDPMKGGN